MSYTPSKFHPSNPAYDPPPDPEYFLKDCPRDKCMYCHEDVFSDPLSGSVHVSTLGVVCEWDTCLTIDENRIRYAAERLADAQVRQP